MSISLHSCFFSGYTNGYYRSTNNANATEYPYGRSPDHFVAVIRLLLLSQVVTFTVLMVMLNDSMMYLPLSDTMVYLSLTLLHVSFCLLLYVFCGTYVLLGR